MEKLIGKYINGNYNVMLFDKGTKIRTLTDPAVGHKVEFPESIDIKITNKCELNCPYCHEDSNMEGSHADLNLPFIDTLQPYTELAIGGGNPLLHPDLIPFLRKLKDRKIIANITVNQDQLNIELLNYLIAEDLVKGIGISVNRFDSKVFEFANNYEHAVLHVIAGVITVPTLIQYKNTKVLILGYKQLRRGVDYYSDWVEENLFYLNKELPAIKHHFKVISFDNLAITQLNVEQVFSNEWGGMYMGNDGQFTMYIDMVNKKYAKSSTSNERYDIIDNIKEMQILQGTRLSTVMDISKRIVSIINNALWEVV